MECGAACTVPAASTSGRLAGPQPPRRHPSSPNARGRRSLRTRALLSELDLPAAAASLAGLADALPALGAHLHLPAAAAASAASAAPAQASSDLALGLGLGAGGGQEQLRHLLALADAAAVQFGDLADAAAAAAADAAADPDKTDNGWLQPLVSGLEAVLAFIEDGLKRLNVPYSYGWSIVVMTACIKVATFPLTKIQVESALNVQRLKPQIEAIKAQYGENKDAISRETQALYDKAGINPLAGCLPSLATIPIFIGLFRSLSDFASQDEAGAAAFYWIPSLAGPTSMAARQAGSGTAWLFPLVDGVPPIGWDLASRYLALPIALVVAQYISNAIVQPPQTDDSDAAKVGQALVKVLPLMIGWFALNVPSGLSLYYFANTVFTATQQIYLKKLGGAKLAEYDLGPIELGKARRTGTAAAASLASADAGDAPPLADGASSDSLASASASASLSVDASVDGASVQAEGGVLAAAAAAPAVPQINRRCKRRRRELLETAA